MANAIQDPMDRLSTIIEGEKSPFVELSERMKETSKDVQNLNLSILDLAIALEKRAGITKEKKDKDSDTNKKIKNDSGMPFGDFEDFKKGLIHGFTGAFVDFKDKISTKSEMPASVEKSNQDINVEKENNVELIRQNVVEESDTLKDENLEQNKVLSNMVEALTNMRDDTTQRKLLDEAASIKKIISDQNKKTELPGGIEPNTEESKQEDREKLAEAIARKLSEAMADLGIGSNSGFGIPGIGPGGGGGKPGGKTPNKPGGAKGPKFRIPAGLGSGVGRAALLAGGSAAALAGLGLGAYEASEYLKETDYGDKMAEGAGKDAEKAFKNINADFSKLDITQQQAQDILNQPDSPGKKRDLEAFGGEEALRKKAGLLPLETMSEEPPPRVEQASLRKYDYIPESKPTVIPEITPKKEENNVGNMLNQVSDQNTELKMFNTGQSEAQQILAPIISKQTINNTEQTMVAVAPSPHSNASSLIKWQLKRSSYTDSYS